MTVPSWFERELQSQFAGQLRIRWSLQLQQFVIEQKVGRQKPSRQRLTEFDDRAIRERDGYAFVMAIAHGDRMACPKCSATVKLPVMQMRSAKCTSCGAEFRACFWPLGESLLQRLRWSDPHRGGYERVMTDLELADSHRESAMRRKQRNEIEDATKDEFTRLFDIQSVGYTGREWDGARQL